MKKLSPGGTGILIAASILIVWAAFSACTDQTRPFYDKVLNDFDTSSYFVALNVKASSYRGRAIVENNDLYTYLNKTRGFDKSKYKSFMEGLLIHHRALKIKDKDFLTFKILKDREPEEVLRNTNMGRDKFIEHYFNGPILNYGLTVEDRNAVIDQLFYWEYPAKFDKSTGDLVIG